MSKDNLSLGSIIDESFAKAEKGMPYSAIRKDLQYEGLNDDIISLILREVDEKVIASDLKKAKSQKLKEQMYWGYALMTVGAVLALLAYAGMIHIKPRFFYVVSFGPVIGGYLLFLKARSKLKK